MSLPNRGWKDAIQFTDTPTTYNKKTQVSVTATKSGHVSNNLSERRKKIKSTGRGH